jgi:hypothetical protein
MTCTFCNDTGKRVDERPEPLAEVVTKMNAIKAFHPDPRVFIQRTPIFAMCSCVAGVTWYAAQACVQRHP